MNWRRLHSAALALALLMPAAITLLVGLAALLVGLGDAQGARFANGVALAAGAAWTLALIALVVLGAIRAELQSQLEHEGIEPGEREL
ncbi:MAG: hypothetical protein K1X71_12695 [Pirellulales bacterium]|nr:hypothetical protein [Pirellulales bacterium]